MTTFPSTQAHTFRHHMHTLFPCLCQYLQGTLIKLFLVIVASSELSSFPSFLLQDCWCSGYHRCSTKMELPGLRDWACTITPSEKTGHNDWLTQGFKKTYPWPQEGTGSWCNSCCRAPHGVRPQFVPAQAVSMLDCLPLPCSSSLTALLLGALPQHVAFTTMDVKPFLTQLEEPDLSWVYTFFPKG